jgi:hypothetical protein
MDGNLTTTLSCPDLSGSNFLSNNTGDTSGDIFE